MSEEKKENLTPETDSEALNEELEQLKDTFQAAYDETVKEEQSAPVIQELEVEVPDSEDDDDETEETENNTSATVKKAKKEKKEKKKKSKLPIIIPLILCILIILPLGAYFVTTLAVPDFSNFLSCIVSAESAEDPADAISYYEDALDYCTDNEKLEFYSQTIHEKITVLTYESTGYADAYTYMTTNLTEEQIAAPTTSELKNFLKVCESIDAIANKSFDAVKNAIGETGEEPDYDALVSELNVPESITDDVKEALTYLAAGIIAEEKAETDEELQEAITNYMSAYSAFTAVGAKGQDLLEKIAISMYNNSYAYEAKYIMLNMMTEDMLASPINDEFSSVAADIDTIASYTGSVYEVATQAVSDGKTSEDDLSSYVEGEFSDKIKAALASLIGNCIDAIKAEAENNLTEANTKYSAVLEYCTTFGITETKVAEKSIAILYTLGDVQSANALAEEYITQDVLAASTEEFKELYEEITLVYAAMDAANEVFYPYYYDYASSGAAVNEDGVIKELDALISEDSTIYDKAYVEYYKYLTVGFASADEEVMYDYLASFAEMLPDAKFIYGYGLIDAYSAMGKNKEAVALAKELLEINVADDYCNMILSLELRKDGDLEKALETALNGIELSGASAYCARQAVILYMLDGDYETAYKYASDLYEKSFSVETCELMYVLATYYAKETEDTDLIAELEEMIEYIDYVYSYYSVQHTDTTNALIDGSLTLKEVFLSADNNYDLL